MDGMKDLLIYCLQLIKMYRSGSFIHFFLNIFQYEIPVLVIGKLEGLYGKKLSSSVDYINNATNIAQTQNGGDKNASDNYINALNCINNNPELQKLIQKYS